MSPVENARRRPRVAELLEGVAGLDWNGKAAALAVDEARDLVRFLALAEAMARALARVHEHGVTHGDLRPENFRRRGEEILLAGFDHAVTFDAGHDGFAPLDRLPSDVAYLAPEQTGRMNRPVDHRADLYALGGTLYRLATGRAPHAGTDRAALIHAHLAADPRPPDELARWMPPVLSQIILRLLAKEPDERYQSASGLADDLASLRAAVERGEPLSHRTQNRRVERVFRTLHARTLHSRTSGGNIQTAAFFSTLPASRYPSHWLPAGADNRTSLGRCAAHLGPGGLYQPSRILVLRHADHDTVRFSRARTCCGSVALLSQPRKEH